MKQNINEVDIGASIKDDDYCFVSIDGALRRIKKKVLLSALNAEVANLKDALSEKNFKSYYSLEQIGVTTDVSKVTMTEILNALPSYSELIVRVDTSWNKAEFPTLYATLNAVKHEDYERCYAFLINTNSAELCFGSMNSTDSTFAGWKEVFTTEGGTLSGDLWLGDKYGALSSTYFRTRLSHYKNNADLSNVSALELLDNKPLDEAIIFVKRTNGSDKNYRLHGEHNKPSGSYVGNGSATERKIETGSISRMFYIYNLDNGYGALVWGNGALLFHGSLVTTISGEEAKIGAGGVITLKTDSAFLNKNGATLNYYSL